MYIASYITLCLSNWVALKPPRMAEAGCKPADNADSVLDMVGFVLHFH
jgi:hypothetical protein